MLWRRGGGHGRYGAADEHAEGDAEGECEEGVTDRDDASGAVEQGFDPVAGRVVDVVRPASTTGRMISRTLESNKG